MGGWVDEYADVWIGGWRDGYTDGWMGDGGMDIQMCGWGMEGWIYIWVDGRMDIQMGG